MNSPFTAVILLETWITSVSKFMSFHWSANSSPFRSPVYMARMKRMRICSGINFSML